MTLTQEITLDIFNAPLFEYINAKQEDNVSRVLVATITANGETLKPDHTKARAIFRATKPDKTGVMDPAVIGEDGKITFALTDQVLAVPGDVAAEIAIVEGDQVLTTATFYIQVEEHHGGSGVTSTDEFLVLVQATEKAAEATEAANKAAEEANAAAREAREATEATLDAAGEADTAAGTATSAAGEAAAAAGAANEAAEKAAELAAHPDMPRNSTWWTWDVETHQYRDTGERACLNYDKTYTSVAEMEADAANQPPGTVAIISADVNVEDNAKTYVMRADGAWGFLADLSGFPGVGIESIALTEGDHAPGTTDTYTIRLTDGREVTVPIYNGADGQVRSVNGQTGAIKLVAGDVGAYTKTEADASVRTVKDALPRCWELTVRPDDWVSTDEPEASKQGRPDSCAALEAEGALATDRVVSIVCTGGDETSAAQWQYLTVGDGTITLWSVGAPAGEMTLVVTVMPGSAAGGVTYNPARDERADYVIARGQSDMWQYCIWKSGWCEVWGDYKYTAPAMLQDWNVWYLPANETPSVYPITFDTPPLVVVSIQNHGYWTACADPGTTTNPPRQYAYAPSDQHSAGTVVTWHIHAAGYVTKYLSDGGTLWPSEV